MVHLEISNYKFTEIRSRVIQTCCIKSIFFLYLRFFTSSVSVACSFANSARTSKIMSLYSLNLSSFNFDLFFDIQSRYCKRKISNNFYTCLCMQICLGIKTILQESDNKKIIFNTFQVAKFNFNNFLVLYFKVATHISKYKNL